MLAIHILTALVFIGLFYRVFDGRVYLFARGAKTACPAFLWRDGSGWLGFLIGIDMEHNVPVYRNVVDSAKLKNGGFLVEIALGPSTSLLVQFDRMFPCIHMTLDTIMVISHREDED